MTFVFTFFIIIRRRAIIECALVIGFGANTSQPGGLFGATNPQQQNTSLFGTPTTSSAFGAKTPTRML